VSCYADTSFLVSFNLPFDSRHGEAVALVAALPPRPLLPLTPFGLLELRNALARLEWKGILHAAESEAIMGLVGADIETGLYAATPLRSYAWMEAGMEAVRTLTPRTGTRTLDALHVGMARLHGAKTFLSFDSNQRRAALGAGLKVLPVDGELRAAFASERSTK
jgi:predicted nucleic acid-binding protein